MKLLKNTLRYLDNSISFNNFNSEQFEWNKQPGGLYDDNRMKIVTKPMVENKPQVLENGDKMRIPGVLDYTGAKYPFKKKKKKKLIGKHQTGGQSQYNPGQYILNEMYGNLPIDHESTFQGQKSGQIAFYSPNKTVSIEDNDYGENQLTITSNQLGSKEVIDKIKQLIPDPKARESLYKVLDPKHPQLWVNTTKEDKKLRKNYNDTLANRLKKLSMIYDICGGNIVADTTNKDRHYLFISGTRPHVDKKEGRTVLYQRGNNEWSADSIISELAHAFQMGRQGKSLLSLIGGDIKDQYGINGYHRYGHSENQAHAILEPAFRDFIFNPKYKTTKDLVNLVKEYKTKAKEDYDKLLQERIAESRSRLMYSPGRMKNGSKIYIKKKNRGKFTDYCGGNVTQDCINRAKSSGNKTLVKRAVFAENARKWKH